MSKSGNKPPGSAHLNFTMAGITSLGGILGFVKGKSVPSLVAGVGCGALFAFSGSKITDGDHKFGHALATGTGIALAAGMGPRGLKTRKFMPLAIATLGLLSAAYNGKKTAEWWDSD